MEKINVVYIATSIDGYIADRNGGLEWLNIVPNPEHKDLGFTDFMNRIDALVMGRTTFETVVGFGGEWPYSKPVFVLSTTMGKVPEAFKDKAEVVKGTPVKVTEQLNKRGFNRLYIDGGKTIQSFLREDMIDELIITRIPILLGGGFPLFADLPQEMEFEHLKSELLLNALTQDSYRRKRTK